MNANNNAVRQANEKLRFCKDRFSKIAVAVLRGACTAGEVQEVLDELTGARRELATCARLRDE